MLGFFHVIARTDRVSYFKQGYGWITPRQIEDIEAVSKSSVELLSAEEIKQYMEFCYPSETSDHTESCF